MIYIVVVVVVVVVVRFTCSRSIILKFTTDVNRLKYFCAVHYYYSINNLSVQSSANILLTVTFHNFIVFHWLQYHIENVNMLQDNGS